METEGQAGVERGVDQRVEPRVDQRPEYRPPEPQRAPTRPSGVKVTQVIDYVFWVVAAVILLRFVFKLIAANVTNPFVKLLYTFTDPMVLFFRGIVGDINAGGYVLELSALIALLIFWLLYHAVLRLVAMLQASTR